MPSQEMHERISARFKALDEQAKKDPRQVRLDRIAQDAIRGRQAKEK